MSDDCEIPEFYVHHEPKARKIHRCCECAAPIPKGEIHFTVTMKYDGEISRERQHLLCMRACMWVRDYQDECLYYGGLKDWWNDCLMESEQRDPEMSDFRKMLAQIKRRERQGGDSDSVPRR